MSGEPFLKVRLERIGYVDPKSAICALDCERDREIGEYLLKLWQLAGFKGDGTLFNTSWKSQIFPPWAASSYTCILHIYFCFGN